MPSRNRSSSPCVTRPWAPHAIAPHPGSVGQLQHTREPAVIGEQQQPLGADVEPPMLNSRGSCLGSPSNTVGRPCGSALVLTKPTGLW